VSEGGQTPRALVSRDGRRRIAEHMQHSTAQHTCMALMRRQEPPHAGTTVTSTAIVHHAPYEREREREMMMMMMMMGAHGKKP